MLNMSPKAISKITSSFMVITSDGQKNDLGLRLKFEARALKVIDYSRKDQRYWEFSDKAVDLLREYKQKYSEIMLVLNRNGDGKYYMHCLQTKRVFILFTTASHGKGG